MTVVKVSVGLDLTEITDHDLLAECDQRSLRTVADLTAEEVRSEYAHRFGDPQTLLDGIYQEFVRRGDAPECLRQYLYEQIGRTLP